MERLERPHSSGPGLPGRPSGHELATKGGAGLTNVPA
jgi:hypothetical protein